MAYESWFTLGGTEIINGPRTRAYISSLLPSARVHDLCQSECGCDHLHAFLGDAPYASPLADDAPWTDPERPESYEFLGAYPLGITNLTDGTVESAVVQGFDDGGWVVNRRHAAREVAFSVALFSTTEDGDTYGFDWLKAVLEGSCEDDGCGGTSTQLCFLSACADPAEFTGRIVSTRHSLSDWTLYRSSWTGRTLNLNEQASWAEISVPGSCGEIEWTVTLQGEAGNRFVARHSDREEVFVLDGGVQEFRITTLNDTLRLGIPDVSGMASWQEPDTEAELDAMTLADMAQHIDSTITVPGGMQSAWDQYTTIPLPLTIMEVYSDARFERTTDECAEEFLRFLRRVKHTDGPRTRQVQTMPSGGIVRTVDFILTAEKPHVFGNPVLVAKGTDSDVVAMAVPYRTQRLSQNIPDCVEQPVTQVIDPSGHIIPPPPAPSLKQIRPRSEGPPGTVVLDRTGGGGASSTLPYAVMIPASTIPQWLNTVPIVSITAGPSAVRRVRVRFFPVPLDSYLPSDIDPCSACGSFQIDYLPAGATFTFDATEERTTVSTGGIVQPANNLVSGDKGVGGATWPLLSCGIPYMVLIDSRGQELSDVELHMVVRS